MMKAAASANNRDKSGRGKALGQPSLEEFVAQRDYTGNYFYFLFIIYFFICYDLEQMINRSAGVT